MARNAQQTADSTPRDSHTAATIAVEHPVHGLVAIANGPDYCLCGATWPCSGQEDRAAQP